jgi:mRNA-degrading endonuclease toxin of MazEF toxin-antitoxin module
LQGSRDLRTAKTRPALVVRSDALETGIPQIVVAMITSRVFRARQNVRAQDPLIVVGFELTSEVVGSPR